jgi:putative membrane protein
MEVRLAEMAQRQAKDGDVKRLANRLHDDFSKYLSRWTDLNGREPHMGKLHQEKITRLQKANGKQFDRTYVDIVVENINSMIPYFEKEGRDAKTAKVRNLVNDELATLRENLQAARRIDRQALSSSK